MPSTNVRIQKRRIHKLLFAQIAGVLVARSRVPNHMIAQHHGGRERLVAHRALVRLQFFMHFALMRTLFAFVDETLVAQFAPKWTFQRVASSHMAGEMDATHEGGFAQLNYGREEK